ncbi:metal ABC transporter substrate-binding protein [Treponema sp.]|uniref:metal ABC transporter substrate-binding protein n=1 Tax=Treponema sp. TaxID=166 RepID=UPI001E00CD89|nr:metal ABC transporter substrate-binding protein [Treponema sp.]MBS7241633.1 zinc ABC transporter substrate-binding protein [Treponema sp.]MCI6441922.1 metal ABC transporter substrate-binding protein [Spirochaetia bacterium]MDY4132797.1 metal ABC transporter substrate-binding protein [Treponema sp.]
MNNTNNRKKLAFFMAAAIFLLSSCSPKKATAVQPNNTDTNTIKITATFYPLYVSLLNITDGVEGIELSLLAPPDTGCLHDYQLTTKDMKKIENSNILVANGAGMEDFIEKILETKKDSLIIASEGFELTDNNSHVWVSPEGAIHQTQRIVEGLSHLDPSNATKYVMNGNAYLLKLQNLRNHMHSILDEYSGKKIVTFHEAFPYFASEFNLEIASVIEREPGEAPGPKELKEQISEINSIISDGNKIALFAEPQYSSSAAEIIAKETGLKVYELDPCVTGNLKSEYIKDSYITAMKKNAEVLKEALAK